MCAGDYLLPLNVRMKMIEETIRSVNASLEWNIPLTQSKCKAAIIDIGGAYLDAEMSGTWN